MLNSSAKCFHVMYIFHACLFVLNYALQFRSVDSAEHSNVIYSICFNFRAVVLAHCDVLGTCLNAFFVLGSPALQKSPTKVPQQGPDANALAHLGGVSNNPVLNRSYTQN